MNIIKIFAIVLLSLAAATFVGAQDFEEIKVPLTDPAKTGTLKVELHKGPITVKGTSRKDVLVRYKPLANNKKPKIETGKDGLKKIAGSSLNLEISEKNNTVWVESQSWNNGVILEIEVPLKMNLKLQSYNQGAVNIDNINGVLELTSYNGEVTATNISGSLLADTYNGKITATFKQVTPDAPLAFTNYNGGIDLTFPANFKGTLKIKSENGETYTGFDVVLEKQKIKKESKEGMFKVKVGEWIVGKINGGGAEVTIQNHNGDVYIRKN